LKRKRKTEVKKLASMETSFFDGGTALLAANLIIFSYDKVFLLTGKQLRDEEGE
jgi:hypothetical protein